MRMIYRLFGKRSHNAACQRESDRHLDNAERYMQRGMLCETIRSVELSKQWEAKKL